MALCSEEGVAMLCCSLGQAVSSSMSSLKPGHRCSKSQWASRLIIEEARQQKVPPSFSGLWLAGKEGMEKKMEATIVG